MNNFCEAVSKLYEEKENQIIIGLTGRTGAGCSTVAEILKKDINELELEYEENENKTIKDKYEFEIIKKYIKSDNRWRPFEIIEGSCVILSYVLEQKTSEKDGARIFIDFLRELQRTQSSKMFRIDNFSELVKEIYGLKYIFDEIYEYPLSKFNNWENCRKEEVESYYDIYINKLPDYKNRIRKVMLKYTCYEENKKKIQDESPVKYHLYTYILQKIANNIRASGNPYVENLHQDKILNFAKRIQMLIELIKIHSGDNKTRICIDAIRNANESNYLKEMYRSYYLISISVDEKMRKRRLGM